MELLLGCGNRRQKLISVNERTHWNDLVTLDADAYCKPDVVWDLELCPWPFQDSEFDEVHAYEVLEHIGAQGDFRAFFDHFAEVFRILKGGGYLAATVPSLKSPWLLAEPSHRRVISRETLTFLDQREYEKQVGKTAMSDFRWYWKGDLRLCWYQTDEENFSFLLQAVK